MSRSPVGTEARSSVSLRGGSFGTWEGSLSHADRVGKVDYGLAYSGFRTDGDWKFQSIEIQTGTSDPVPSRELERINNDSESHALLAQASLELAPGVRLRATDQLFFVSRALTVALRRAAHDDLDRPGMLAHRGGSGPFAQVPPGLLTCHHRPLPEE